MIEKKGLDIYYTGDWVASFSCERDAAFFLSHYRKLKTGSELDVLAAVICDYFDITVNQLKSSSRKREHVTARIIFSYLARYRYNLTFAAIGAFINRDHSTVIHEVDNFNQWSVTPKAYSIELKHYENIAALIGEGVKQE